MSPKIRSVYTIDYEALSAGPLLLSLKLYQANAFCRPVSAVALLLLDCRSTAAQQRVHYH